MKKLIFLTALISFISTTVLFFFLLNLKLIVLSPEKTKEVAEESNFYSFAAGYVKNNVVESTKISLNDANVFNQLNSSITAESIKPDIDQAIDQYFTQSDDQPKSDAVKSLGFSLGEASVLPENFVKETEASANSYLIYLFVTAVIAGTMMILSAGAIDQKIRGLGLALICIALVLFLILMGLNYIVPNQAHQLSALVFSDAKLVNGVEKILAVVLSKQVFYYIVEIVSAFILGLVLIFFSKFGVKEQRSHFDAKI